MITETSRRLVLLLALTASLAGRASSQLMEAKLVPFDGDPGDQFGWRVAHVPSWAFVGCNLDDDVQDQSGAVYVYESVGGQWSFTQKIKMPQPGFSDQFGNDVAASGGWMVAGAWKDNPGGVINAGSAHVYLNQGGSWLHQQELVASDFNQPGPENFGEKLALEGPTMVVGMPRDDFKHINSGSIYVFELQGATWLQVAKLGPESAQDWESAASFGFAVDVEGDTIVASAPFMDNGVPGSNRGAAFVFERIGGAWIQTQKLLPDDPMNSDFFGVSVGVSGDTILIGAQNHKHSQPPDMEGAGYVFTKSGGSWVQTQELVVSDPSYPLGLGAWVDLDGDLAVFGIGGDADLGPGTGSVYLFRRTAGTWEQIGKLLAPDGDLFDGFGTDARIVGDSVLAAAVFDDDACSDIFQCDVGAAYVFELAPDTRQYGSCISGAPCGNLDDHGGCATSIGVGAVLAAAGTTSVQADSLRFEARWLPPNVLGILFMGGGPNWTPFGDGRLVVSSGPTGIFRFLPPQNSGAEGVMTWDGGLVAASQSLPMLGHIDADETWYMQVWYRDPTGPCGSGFNTTNGLQVDFTP